MNRERPSAEMLQQLREHLKDVYPRLRRKKLRETGGFFMSDLRALEKDRDEGKMSEDDFWDNFSSLMHNYGISWAPGYENKDYIRVKEGEE